MVCGVKLLTFVMNEILDPVNGKTVSGDILSAIIFVDKTLVATSNKR